METNEKKSIPLGIQVDHSPTYDPGHLFPVPRNEARKILGITSAHPLPFSGIDFWNVYELSWLNAKGKPRVALGELIFPCTSKNIVESKSLKLYLNSFNQTRFDSQAQVAKHIRRDLTRCTGADVRVNLFSPDAAPPFNINGPEGTCIDHLDISAGEYEVNETLLTTKEQTVTETLYSNLLRTNCPVTRQPDWATVTIAYTGPAMDHEGLLKYIISFRLHTGFHENCVENIFTDMMNRCQPETLTVHARFTRRGGIDINPFRTNTDTLPANTRFIRQ